MVNYSKWDNIELSDDEDNFHPNIDNNLMIRLQREKRQQREAEEARATRRDAPACLHVILPGFPTPPARARAAGGEAEEAAGGGHARGQG